MDFMLMFSRQGKVRLQKWYCAYPEKQKKKIIHDITTMVLARDSKMCNVIEWKHLKIVYNRYTALYICCGVQPDSNELITLEIIHRYVELLHKYFKPVTELDIVFNFEKAYFVLDELLLGGQIQETSKKEVIKSVTASDLMQEDYLDQKQRELFEDPCLDYPNVFRPCAFTIGPPSSPSFTLFVHHVLFSCTLSVCMLVGIFWGSGDNLVLLYYLSI